ncbi:ASCH domain-containing protein [Promicromonospora citrea]|uniref:ASCH domain-containing protein n=1 Tax=Promicromonospora citrea TaxID=43677 RepID=A0A8H9L6I4_9MICO|nr:ASCH domain-containing protein [Promicromonospora citrea]GGM36816.1 hypothetical protein GCM10010102_35330 [Promicromonospora citrea]
MNQDPNPQAAGDEPAVESATDATLDPATDATFDPATFDPEAVPAEDAELAAEVLDFWAAARQFAGMAKASVVVGQTVNETVPPQAWSFGDEPGLAQRLLDAVLAGDKTATSSALWDYEDEGAPLPVVGELSILLDGEGHPRALIRTTSVETVAFEDVDEDFAAAEGEDDRTLASWRAGHEAYFRRTLGPGREFAPDMPLLCERFELLYPQR